MKTTICTVIGAIGGLIASAFGGWNAALVGAKYQEDINP